MDTASLKEYIFENKKIEYVLEQIGCNKIKYNPRKQYYTCTNHDGDNPTAINVKDNKYLNVVNWTRQTDFKKFGDKADLISLVQYNKRFDFKEAIAYLCGILGIDYKWTKPLQPETIKKDPLEIFKRIRNRAKNDAKIIPDFLDDALLDEYVPLLHVDWFREGIMPWSRDKFGIVYSYRQKRIIIPMRYWLTGELMGTNARTTIKNPELFGVLKYFITPGYRKDLNLYGLYENYEDIKRQGYVVVYESEKSVLKRDSKNDSTGVALSGHTISDEQVRILVGLDVDIVISLDNGISIDEVRGICEKFYGIRNVYYTWDKYNLLGKKDSAADAVNKIYDFLFKYKVPYDYGEHTKYMKYLKG